MIVWKSFLEKFENSTIARIHTRTTVYEIIALGRSCECARDTVISGSLTKPTKKGTVFYSKQLLIKRIYIFCLRSCKES